MNCMNYISMLAMSVCLIAATGCKSKPEQQEEQASEKTEARVKIQTTLFDKSLPEIKELVNGKWELVSGQNPGQFCEFEDTYIKFDNDTYIWTEGGKDEPGDLNWRKADTGAGYDAFLMDVFYATNPAYPLAINGDTLFIQDCSETNYKYTLIRR